MKHPEMLLSNFETVSFLIKIATFARALDKIRDISQNCHRVLMEDKCWIL